MDYWVVFVWLVGWLAEFMTLFPVCANNSFNLLYFFFNLKIPSAHYVPDEQLLPPKLLIPVNQFVYLRPEHLYKNWSYHLYNAA